MILNGMSRTPSLTDFLGAIMILNRTSRAPVPYRFLGGDYDFERDVEDVVPYRFRGYLLFLTGRRGRRPLPRLRIDYFIEDMLGDHKPCRTRHICDRCGGTLANLYYLLVAVQNVEVGDPSFAKLTSHYPCESAGRGF